MLVRALGAVDRTADLVPDSGPVDPMLGIEVGDYELASVLGQGSFAVVYRAVHKVSGEPVAVKLLHGHLAQDAEIVRRFVGEARATLLVAHENVVQVKAIDALEGNRYFIVLELLEGETLAERIDKGPMAFADAAPLLRQMCDALGAAHTVGIVHRDLKPENLYLARKNDRPVVKVMDFGVARRSHLAVGEKRTQSGLVLGTPLYLSPEQSMGLEVDARADVYSVGVIMYQLLTGRVPFDGANAVEVILAHRNSPVRKPSELQPSLPPEVDTIVLTALAKKPDDRYQTMDKFEAALGAAVAAMEARGLPRPSPTIDLLLALEAAPADAPYRLLGVREGADDATIRKAAAQLWQRFDVARGSADGDLFVRLDAAGKRVSTAEALLLDPPARAWFDAGKANFVGVARAITSGLAPAALEELRRKFVKSHPEVLMAPPPAPAEKPTPAQEDAYALELARRLKADPLNLELHRLYWPLRTNQRQRGSTGIRAAP
jgi:Protein kinase domain